MIVEAPLLSHPASSDIPMMEPVVVVFLDFDGVISTHRAHIAGWNQPVGHARWIDPVSTGMLRELSIRFPFKLVVSSVWRTFGRRVCADALRPSGLDELLHDDWCTNQSPDGQRPVEIDEWLSRHRVIDYAVVDDDSYAWTGHQLARLSKCDPENGFVLSAYQQLETILKGIYNDLEC